MFQDLSASTDSPTGSSGYDIWEKVRDSLSWGSDTALGWLSWRDTGSAPGGPPPLTTPTQQPPAQTNPAQTNYVPWIIGGVIFIAVLGTVLYVTRGKK